MNNMGIQIEFNPDLALRDYSEFRKGKHLSEECIPAKLEEGKEYFFLKRGQRNYWLHGELPLIKTEGNQKLSPPIASIMITEVVHFLKDGEVWTKGKFRVVEIFSDNEIHFNGFAKIRR